MNEKEKQIVWGRKFGSLSKSAPFPVKELGVLGRPTVDHGTGGGSGVSGLLPLQVGGQALAGGEQLGAVFLPQPFHLENQREQRGLGQVGTCPEGLLVWGQQNGQRPAAGTGNRLTNRHIHRIYIRAFLSVNLDTDIGTV